MNTKALSLLSLSIILIILIIDQSSKFWIKTNMEQGDEFLVMGQSWFRIHFVENEGMAFGMSLGGSTGKLLLSVFRLIAVSFLFYLLYKMIIGNEHRMVIISFSMILAGALGNIIDSLFYGMWFSSSPYHGGLAVWMPDEGGYAPFLMGKVVDMLYFPLIKGHFPTWMPFWAGEDFEFFRPVFNVADSSIFCGICLFLIFYRKVHHTNNPKETDHKSVVQAD